MEHLVLLRLFLVVVVLSDEVVEKRSIPDDLIFGFLPLKLLLEVLLFDLLDQLFIIFILIVDGILLFIKKHFPVC